MSTDNSKEQINSSDLFKTGRGGYSGGKQFVLASELPTASQNANTTDEEVTNSFNKIQNKEKSKMGLKSVPMEVETFGETYGIGAKLLTGMGYQPGKGLGKNRQGINAPIKVSVKKGRQGLGFDASGKENKNKVMPPPTNFIFKPKSFSNFKKEPNWQKQKAEKMEKIAHEDIFAEDFLDQRKQTSSDDLANVTVIDLTGPQERILKGYHEIFKKKEPSKIIPGPSRRCYRAQSKVEVIEEDSDNDLMDIPEVIPNVEEILQDDFEEEILIEEIPNNDDQKAKDAAKKIDRLTKLVEEKDQKISQLESVITQMKTICTISNSNLDSENVYSELEKLKKSHKEEWEIYQLYSLVSSIAIPHVKEALKLWKPLENPELPQEDTLKIWAELLEDHIDHYEIILWESWIQSIRQAITQWDVKSPEPMTRLVEFWKNLKHNIPSWLMGIILEDLVTPKLSKAVQDWKISDELPLHSWIHPWIPHLENLEDNIYVTVRTKLSNALDQWDPSDGPKAKQLITPWVNVFPKERMETFLLRNIVPKLKESINSFIFDQSNQISNPFLWVIEWVNIIPFKNVVEILNKSFFPKWLKFLGNWLNQTPDYDAVRQWYLFWKEMLTKNTQLVENVVTENLGKGLEMISAGIQCPGQLVDYSYILNRHSTCTENLTPGGPELMVDASMLTSQIPQTFKDLVQMKCEELGVLFMPIPNRKYEGKQVYKCASSLIYICNKVIFLQRGGDSWFPISISRLLKKVTR